MRAHHLLTALTSTLLLGTAPAVAQSYDLIVLDCPPILVGPEGAAIAALADKCVLVTAWDRTPITAVRRAMTTLQRRPRAQTAVYVNRVPPEYRFGRLRGE